VASVAFVGNRQIAAREFGTSVRRGQRVSDSLLALDQERIRDVYARRGFYWTAVEVEPQLTRGRVALTFRIREGERARIGAVHITGNRLISAVRLRSLLPFREGWFTESGIPGNVRALLDFYGDNGFPFCEVRPESLIRRDSLVSYTLVILEGPEVRLSDVRFSGPAETRPGLLKRLLGLRTGVPFSETETRKAIARLAADPLLTIKGYEIRRSGDDYWLDVAVQEKKSSRVLGSAAYSAEYRELVGQFDLNLANLFGTRRSVVLSWQGTRSRQDFDFAYTEPWLLGTGIDARAEVQHRIRDTSYAATNLGLAGRLKVSELLHLSVETGYELVAAGAGLRSARTWWVGSGLEADNRDNRANPARGAYGNLLTRFGSRAFDTSGSQALARGYLDVLGTFPLARQLNLTTGGHLRGLLVSGATYDYDRFELGGAASIRGFREGELKTARAAWLNTELRYLTGQSSRVYPFFDVALLQDSAAYRWRAAYGVGLRVGSRLGIFGLDYGVPLRTGSGPLKGKLHFSLQTDF
jgi:outer membrane protein assembly factor BamA